VDWASTRRRFRVIRFRRLLAFIVLGVLAGPTVGKTNQEAEALAGTILTHIRECLPITASRSVDAEGNRVRAFASRLMEVLYNTPELRDLQGAAIAAIDTANNPAATPDSLVRAAIAGVSTYLISRSKSECGRCQEAHYRTSPTNTEVDAIWVITFPHLALGEALLDRPCSGFDHYFDFPSEGVVGVVLDLRGNPGGFLPAIACVAGQFLRPKTPLLRLLSLWPAETLESSAVGRRSPIALPVAIFVDKDTDSGGLALAAAMQDTHRASLIGDSKELANAAITTQVTTRYRDSFLVPIGEMSRINGTSLAAGIQVDVAVPAQDDEALMAAARAMFGGSAHH
jgi:Peptidase family S41